MTLAGAARIARVAAGFALGVGFLPGAGQAHAGVAPPPDSPAGAARVHRTEDNVSGEIALRSIYSNSSDPLTTEKIWVLDPEEPNPHRQRWVLNRKVQLVDLKAREIRGAKSSARYGVGAGGLDALTTAYFRPEGPWYRAMKEFPCSGDPASWFGTLPGARVAADVAARDWERELAADRIKLSILLKRVAAATPGMALERARLVFDEWFRALDLSWRSKGKSGAKRAEWKTYQAIAREQGLCSAKAPPATRSGETAGADFAGFEDEYVPPSRRGPVPWELMMERPGTGGAGRAGLPTDEVKILARAPARIWDGLFSVRLNLTVAGRKLNGNFLVDSGSGTSVVSPDFLEGQGILSAWVTVAGAPFRRVPWGGRPGSDGGLAPVVSMDLVELGNTPLQLHDFALFDTEFFSQPDNPSSCCDGVLGTDFLRHYVVELQPGPPAEVKLWPPENFHLAGDELGGERLSSQWFEMALTPAGDVVSACTARLDSPRGEPLRLVGVRWDTGREDVLDIHVPWQNESRAAASRSPHAAWELRCGPAPGEPIARKVPPSYPQPDGTPESAAIQAKVPAVTVGMEFLSRGRVFLDFPHGRIWFPDKTSDEPIRRDHSGLVLKYEFIPGKGDKRGLFVKAINAGTPAEALAKRGLRPGMLVTQIDKIDADGLDARQVSRRLAGSYGEQVYVQWKTPQGLRLGMMKVR